MNGIDLSAHQETTPDLTGLSFVILRASIGTNVDLRYGQHYTAARAAGIPTMAYHYGFPADRAPIADQAAVFLSIGATADYLFLDQEEQGFTDAQASQFIAEVRKVRPCGLYHSSSGFGGVPNDAKWVADWRNAAEAAGHPLSADGSKEFPGWAIWQYDGAGADGIDNDIANPAWAMPEPRYVTAERHRMELDEIAAKLVAERRVTDELTDALEAAPGIERDRIAAAEAERIKAL